MLSIFKIFNNLTIHIENLTNLCRISYGRFDKFLYKKYFLKILKANEGEEDEKKSI